MNGRAYYNEIDDFAADWLENLIRADLIAPGVVDRRSIVDLTPDDVAGHRQVHLFAGIGIWSASLRDAGQRDDAPWWTASCPCPPFSTAGKKKSCPACGGTNPVPHVGRTGHFVCCLCGHDWLADDRHLWPEVWRLVRDCRPAKLAGEQVASPDGQVWLSSVRASLEILVYGVGASDLCAPGVQVPAGETSIGRETIEWIRGAVLTCPDPQLAADLRDYAEWFEREVGIGAPHIRQRLFWMAYAMRGRNGPETRNDHRPEKASFGNDGRSPWTGSDAGIRSSSSRMAYANGRQRDGIAGSEGCECDRAPAGWQQSNSEFECRSEVSELGFPDSDRRRARELAAETMGHGRSSIAASDVGELGHADDARLPQRPESEGRGSVGHQGPPAHTSSSLGFFSDSDWVICTDGQARPVEVGTFPLAHGESARVGKLRAYGNQIFRPLAAQFILAADEAIGASQ